MLEAVLPVDQVTVLAACAAGDIASLQTIFDSAGPEGAAALCAARADGSTADAGWGPLHVAAAAGQDAVIPILLAAGADPDDVTADDRKWTALHAAAYHGHGGVCGVLLETGVATNAKAAKRRTALHIAAARGHVGVCRRLVAGGADVMACDAEGATPSALAASDDVLAVLGPQLDWD